MQFDRVNCSGPGLGEFNLISTGAGLERNHAESAYHNLAGVFAAGRRMLVD
jgi:hypothetical protein